MEFRLFYEGPLKAASQSNTRSSEKHTIRKVIHKQLTRLWRVVPHLHMRTVEHSILHAPPQERVSVPGLALPGLPTGVGTKTTMAAAVARQSLLDTLGTKFDKCGYKFVPLVSNHLKLSCGLEILFLRRDMPGIPLIRSGGDIDNRLKVLFDSLRIPGNCDELTSFTKDSDEDPYFFCLMEDDSMITDVSVTTDTLLTPFEPQQEHDVKLIIKVKVRPTDFSFENVAFLP
jgi:hypothetical protein